jgi:RNA polymerase sigma factor (sigma-70 family)
LPDRPDWDPWRDRSLLRLQARQLHLDARLRRRFDSSDVVQETLTRAWQELSGFDGSSEAEFIAWLQKILANQLSKRTADPFAWLVGGSLHFFHLCAGQFAGSYVQRDGGLMAHNGHTPEWHLEAYLPLLRLQVRKMQLHPRFRCQFDSMELVHEAIVKVLQYCQNGRAPPALPAQRVKWLQTILRNTVIDLLRKHKQELLVQRVEGFLSQSSVRLEMHIEAGDSSPSQQAARHEAILALARALDQLPPDQRDVVIQRDLLGLRVRDIAASSNRTRKSVFGLWTRGRAGLRKRLEHSHTYSQ